MKHKMQGKEASISEDQLYKAIAEIKNDKEARLFFQDLCTPAELQAMADRWRVVGLIKKGLPYRKIYELTKVSVTTIGRVSRCILLGKGGYNLLYDRVIKKYQKNGTSRK